MVNIPSAGSKIIGNKAATASGVASVTHHVTIQAPTAKTAIAWVSSTSQASREEKKILQSLAKSENIEELFTLEFSNTAWEDEPANIQMLFYEAFCMLSETSLDTIKEQILKHARDAEKDDVRRIFANLELLINQIMLLYKQDPKLSFFDALDILEERHMALRLREKTNAPEYRNSAAAKYSNYGQGA